MSNYGKLVLPLGMNAIQSSRSLFPWGCWITCCFNCCLEWLLPTMLRVRGLLSCRCFCSIEAHSFLELPFPWSLHCHGSCWACGCCWHWNFIAWVWPQGPRIVCCYYWDGWSHLQCVGGMLKSPTVLSLKKKKNSVFVKEVGEFKKEIILLLILCTFQFCWLWLSAGNFLWISTKDTETNGQH